MQTSFKPWLIVGGSVKTSGDLTHPAISGFYIASYGKAVIIKKRRGELSLPVFILLWIRINSDLL